MLFGAVMPNTSICNVSNVCVCVFACPVLCGEIDLHLVQDAKTGAEYIKPYKKKQRTLQFIFWIPTFDAGVT